MAAWLPVVKVALPYITQIVTAALPVFTSKSEDADRKALNADREALIARQIKELQEAATQNTGYVKELATQLKSTLEGLESAASDLQMQLKRQKQLTIVVLILSILAISLSLLALM